MAASQLTPLILVYAEKAEAAASFDALKFNCAQRKWSQSDLKYVEVIWLTPARIGAHQNTLEQIPIIYLLFVLPVYILAGNLLTPTFQDGSLWIKTPSYCCQRLWALVFLTYPVHFGIYYRKSRKSEAAVSLSHPAV